MTTVYAGITVPALEGKIVSRVIVGENKAGYHRVVFEFTDGECFVVEEMAQSGVIATGRTREIYVVDCEPSV